MCVWLGLAQPPQFQGNAGNTNQALSDYIAPLLRCFSAQAANVDLREYEIAAELEKNWD